MQRKRKMLSKNCQKILNNNLPQGFTAAVAVSLDESFFFFDSLLIRKVWISKNRRKTNGHSHSFT